VSEPIYERGDVVFGADPFNAGNDGRPWLVVSNHEGRPFHGEQYLALTLTTRSWLDGLVSLPETAWVSGGTPADSRVVPWGVQSISAADIDRWQGRLTNAAVEKAIDALVAELRA
jgi:mRNA-degrading endonuclease toxin of MazEF toxin-antitoxin module